MYPYSSPSGAGLTDDKELADKMEQLRKDYIEAFNAKDEDAKRRIIDEENRLAPHHGRFGLNMPLLPRFIRIKVYEARTRYPNDMRRKTIVTDYEAWIDTHEIEMVSLPDIGVATIYTKSGLVLDINDDDFARIEKILRERT
jgi:hypothetical protein